MRAVRVLFCITAITLVTAQQSGTDNINNLIENKPSVRLDPYIRKALLKALSELEQSDEQTTAADNNTEKGSEILQTSEKVTETLPQTNERIQIHSFIVNGQAAFGTSTNTTPAHVDSKISILSTTAGNVENQITDTLPTQTPFYEIFQTKETGINLQQVRSISTSSKFNNENEIQSTKSPSDTISSSSSSISSSSPSSSTSSTSTTTTTTTTTTPRPTHNSDGENIEEVDKRDVQVFPAPLVAAFTVQQDAQGLPKKVIPLYQQTITGQVPKTQPLAAPASPNVVSVPSNFLSPQTLTRPSANSVQHNDFIGQQLALQKQLEEKQRLLEEQLRLLQIQQLHQEDLLRKQQFFLQQKEAQRQQQIFIEQQQRLSGQGPSNFQQPAQLKREFPNQNNNVAPNTQVSIQQSVEQAINLAHQQQLPNREAVDFLLHLRNQRPEQFPLQENHIPQGIANFLQPIPAQNFNHLSGFTQLRPEDQFRAKQANRVFRQESGVGNFGQNFPNFNRFNSINQVPNRFIPNNRPQFNAADVELKQLFVQNGLNGKSQEDLNIVSKVLALNHGVPFNNNVSNRLPFDNRRPFRPF